MLDYIVGGECEGRSHLIVARRSLREWQNGKKTSIMIDLQPQETLLTGAWEKRDGSMVVDAVCERIELLINTGLEAVAARDAGWTRLYRDLNDGRLWEHSYPDSGMHGGGPPSLRVIDQDEATMLWGSIMR